MPNATLRANARTLPEASQHPDADLLALVEQCAAASKVRNDASDALDKAEERCRASQDPSVVIRTERDKQLGLYVGNRAGTAYARDDIPALRALVRANSIAAPETMEVWTRASAILEALYDLIKEEAREKVVSGQADARRRLEAADDAYVEITERLLRMPATTVDGVLAKARLMERECLSAEGLDRNLERSLRRLGPGQEAFASSLARDLIHLAADRASAQLTEGVAQ